MTTCIESLESRKLLAADYIALPQGQESVVVTHVAGTENRSWHILNGFKVSKTGTLFITGTSRADTFALNVKNGRITAGPRFILPVENAAAKDLIISPLDPDSKPTAYSFSLVGFSHLPKIKRISIETMGGDDTVTVNADVPVSIRGARGNDTFNIYAPVRTIEGGSGVNKIEQGVAQVIFLPADSYNTAPAKKGG